MFLENFCSHAVPSVVTSQRMGEVPSLFTLCLNAVRNEILSGNALDALWFFLFYVSGSDTDAISKETYMSYLVKSGYRG